MQPEQIQALRTWLELAYFAAGILLPILAALGLWQLKVAKDQLALTRAQLETSKEIFKTQSRRAAAEAAVIECRRFADTVVQDSLKLDQFVEEEGITFFKDAVLEKTETGVRILLERVKQDDIKKFAKAEPLINSFMNGMEAHALFFLARVADEDIAFNTNAKTFLRLAEDALKICAISNIRDEDAKPLKALYFRWSRKQTASELRLEQERITKKLAKFDEPATVRPIGT